MPRQQAGDGIEPPHADMRSGAQSSTHTGQPQPCHENEKNEKNLMFLLYFATVHPLLPQRIDPKIVNSLWCKELAEAQKAIIRPLPNTRGS
jgi:hypothetical protein